MSKLRICAIGAAVIAALAIPTAAWAPAESHNSSRSNRQEVARPAPNMIAIALDQTPSGFSATVNTATKATAFANVPNGNFVLSASPTSGPAGTIDGASVGFTQGNVTIACPSIVNNVLICTVGVTGGPLTIKVALLEPDPNKVATPVKP